MKIRKTPAPRRAGTAHRKTRLAEELEVVDALAELSTLDSAAFDRCMRLLADLVAGIGRCDNS